MELCSPAWLCPVLTCKRLRRSLVMKKQLFLAWVVPLFRLIFKQAAKASCGRQSVWSCRVEAGRWEAGLHA